MLFITLLALLFFLSELFLAGVISEQVLKELKRELPQHESMELTIKSRPAFKMLTGEIDQLLLQSTDLDLEGLLITNLDLMLRGIKVENQDGIYQIINSELAGLKMIISQSSLNSYVQKYLLDVGDVSLTIAPNTVKITGNIDLMGQNISFDVEGYFRVTENQYLDFVPRRTLVEEVQIPAFLANEIMKEVDFRIDLGLLDLPFQLLVDEVQIGNQEIALIKR